MLPVAARRTMSATVRKLLQRIIDSKMYELPLIKAIEQLWVKYGQEYYINCSSLPAHIDEVRDFLSRRKPLMMFLTETCLTDDIDEHEMDCSGYNLYRNDSHSRHTGGCGVYVRSDIKAEVINLSTLPTMMWILSLSIFNGSQAYIVSVVYRSSNASKKDCIEFFDKWCDDNVDISEKQLVCGDFNVEEGTYQSQLRNINNMKQHVKGATRITEQTKTKIDLVILNMKVEVDVLLNENISDHSTLEIKINGLLAKKEEVKFVKRIVNYSAESFRLGLSEYNWEKTKTRSLNDKSYILTERLNACVQQFVKWKKVTNHTDNVWYDDELADMRQKRDNLYAQAVIDSTSRNWRMYRRTRNVFQTLLRTKKRIYTENKLNAANGNAKETWNILKALLNGRRNGRIGEVEIDGENVNDNLELADKMNKFYVNSVVNISQSIGRRSCVVDNLHQHESKFDFKNVNIRDIKVCLRELKNKRDTEFITPSMIMDAMPIIGATVCEIINESLNEACPDVWKLTTVVPVPKVTRPKKAEDYRPVNMLPTMENFWKP